MKKVIDCHTHLQTEALITEYFSKSEGYAISIKALDSLIGNGDQFYEATKKFKNVFICECIDAMLPIDKQLEKIKENLNKHQIIGIKIYLGYQAIFANDERLLKVYDFARDNNLSVVFHCGVGAENLNSEKEINYATCKPIAEIAKRYPTINFIASHFDYPNFQDCIKIILENKNIFTDISGTYENFDNIDYSILINDFINKLKPVILKNGLSKISDKVMFGTDYFGEGSGFDAIDEYKYTIIQLFGLKNYEKCLFDNCLKAYPKIKEYIKINNDEKTL